MHAPLLAAALSSVFAHQDPLPVAETLLDRRETALGTGEARAKVRALAIEGTLSVTGTKMTARFEELYLMDPQGAEKVLFTTHWGGWGATTMGTDGVVSWSTDPGFGVMVKEGAESMTPRRLWAVQRSAPWRALYRGAKTLARVERDGRGLFELEMQPLEGVPEHWFLDEQTNELARVAVVYPGPSGERLPMEFVFRDWRAVEGVLYPFERTQEVLGSGAKADGAAPMMAIVYRCESVRPLSELDPAKLTPPADVREAIADGTKRAQKPGADAEECRLESREKQAVASVRVEIPADKVSQNLAVIFGEVGRALSSQGVQSMGPPFSRFHSIDREKNRIDLEAGIPVRTPVKESGRVKPSELPAGRVALTWHIGPYDSLERSQDRLGDWIDAQGLKPRGGFWEIYWTDPGLEPDPSTWRTQILWPVE